MSTKQGRIGIHKFHGDVRRFEVLADFIGKRFKKRVKYIVDVAGGQGMLCRFLSKKYNFDCEVIDPRGFPLVGVKSRKEKYTKEMAGYYDLVVGLHPDEALRPIVESGLIKPVIIIPCCNFWSKAETLGRNALINSIEKFYKENHVFYEKVVFDFEGPKNIGLVSTQQVPT